MADLTAGSSPLRVASAARRAIERALYACRTKFAAPFPTDVTVLCIEAGSIAFGPGLSKKSLPRREAVVRIEQLLRQRGACR